MVDQNDGESTEKVGSVTGGGLGASVTSGEVLVLADTEQGLGVNSPWPSLSWLQYFQAEPN